MELTTFGTKTTLSLWCDRETSLLRALPSVLNFAGKPKAKTRRERERERERELSLYRSTESFESFVSESLSESASLIFRVSFGLNPALAYKVSLPKSKWCCGKPLTFDENNKVRDEKRLTISV